MAGVLAHYGVSFQHKNQIYIPCPLPSHTSKHSSNSLSVNLERNIWACKSESCIAGRNGKEGGNVLDFVMWMEGCDLKSAATKIVEWFGTRQEPQNHFHDATKMVEVKSNPPVEATKPAEPAHSFVTWSYGPSNKNGSPKIEEPSGGASVQHPVPGSINNPSPDNHNSSPVPVKGYIGNDVDKWFDSLISDPPDWKQIKNAVKARLIESYHNGKKERLSPGLK